MSPGSAIYGRLLPLLAISAQEVSDASDGLFQIIHPRKGDDAEVVGPGPIESGPLNDQKLFRQKQVEDGLLVAVARADLRVDAWEGIECPYGLHAADPRNVVEQLPGTVALFQQTSRWQYQIVDALVAAECGLDCMLSRHVGAQSHVGQDIQPFDIALGSLLGPGDDYPAGAETSDPVGLGEPVEGQAEHIRRQGGGADVHGIVVEDLVVDLVGEQHQIVLASELDHAFQYFFGVDGAGGVVWIDQHQSLGVWRDLGLDVIQVRPPVGLLVAQVVHRLTAGQAHRCGPQGVVGGRNQYFVAIVEQRLHGHDDQLGYAVTEIDVLDGHAFYLLL